MDKQLAEVQRCLEDIVVVMEQQSTSLDKLTDALVRILAKDEPSPLAAAMREVDFQRNRANDAERLWKADCESWDKDRALLTEAVERCAKVAEGCLVKFSVCKSGILQDQIDIARKDIAAAIRATLSKIKAEAEKEKVEVALADGWQPMETAPKDGTLIDLLFPYPRGRQNDCFWKDTQGWAWREPRWGKGELLPEKDWAWGCYPNSQPLCWRQPPQYPKLYQKENLDG